MTIALLPVSLALVALLQPARTPLTRADLRLSLSPVKPRVLVGEFTKVTIEWRALRAVTIFPGGEIVAVDDGTGFRDHAEASEGEDCSVSSGTPLKRGQRHITERVLGLEPQEAPASLDGLERLSASLRFVFDRPGRYHVKAIYDDVESNVVEIEVVPATGRDAELLASLRSNLAILSSIGTADGTLVGQGEALIEAFGAHVYLAPFIRARWTGIDRWSYEGGGSFDLSDSAFAADHRLWQANAGGGLYGEAWQQAALENIVRDFPGRVAAVEAAERLAELEGLRRDR
jgi:hypothetical protein